MLKPHIRYLFPPRRPLSKAWSVTIDGALAQLKNAAPVAVSPPEIPAMSPVDAANDRAARAEAEHRRALDEAASLKKQLESAQAALASVHASCAEQIKKYDTDLIQSGKTAGSLRRQLSDAVEEKLQAVAAAEHALKQEQIIKDTVANLKSSIESADRRNTALQLELKVTKDDLASSVQSLSQLTASSSKHIAELESNLSAANATAKEHSARISSLQGECKIKDDSLSSASANITSWTELCAGLKRQIDEVRISECSAREAARLESEAAFSKVKIAEELVHRMQTERSAALQAKAEAEASAAAQEKSGTSAVKAAEAQAKKMEDTSSALRHQLEAFEGIQSRLEAAAAARTASDKKCAAAEAAAAAAATALNANAEELESIKGQLQRAIQSGNASTIAKDALKDQVFKLTSQLQQIQQDGALKLTAKQEEHSGQVQLIQREASAQLVAIQKERDALKMQLEQASLSAKEFAASKDALTFQLTKQASVILQERQESAMLRSISDESKAHITQLNEHIEGLRTQLAKAAQAQLAKDEATAALKVQLINLEIESQAFKAKQAALMLSASDEKINNELKAQNKRLQDDKKTLEEQVKSLMDSTRVALSAESARVAAEAQVGPSMEAAQRYKAQLDEMRIRLDEATEATASLSTQADDYSRENAALKEQVICLLVH